MRSLITGSHGFIGSNLVRNLESLGDKVYGYDLKTGDDITNKHQLDDAFHDYQPDRVFHLAAQAFLGPGEKKPFMDVNVNIKGMINILQCLEKYDVPMVYTSSGAVYGSTPVIPHREDAPCHPMSNYGISKLAAEYYLKKWVKTKGVNAKIVRFSSVYGPGRKHGPVNIFINQALQHRPITVYGEGLHTRDLTHISDAIQGLKLVQWMGVPGGVYNVGSGVETSVKEVAEIVACHFDAEVTYVEHEFSEFDLQRSCYDIWKVRNLGYNPIYDIRTGIVKTIEDMQT